MRRNVVLLALVASAVPVYAQSYPVKPVRVMVPWPAGG